MLKKSAMKIIVFCLFFSISNFAQTDTIPKLKVFHYSKLIKELKLSNEVEEIKIDTLSSKKEDYLNIFYNSLKSGDDYIYDILVESETSVDLKLYKPENAKLRTESAVELFAGRINDKTKPIKIDFEWLIDWPKEYPQYRIQVVIEERNRGEKIYNKTKLFYIVNK
jgi:hypothetical protein